MSNNVFIPVLIPSNQAYTPPSQDSRSLGSLQPGDQVTVVESIPGGYGATREVQKSVSQLQEGDTIKAKESLPASYGATQDTFVRVGGKQTVLFFDR